MATLLQINVTANSGSHGKIAEDIGRIALAGGWRSVIAYGRRANSSQSELIRIGSDFSIKEHGIETRLLDNHGLASRIATKEFIKKIDALKPDVVHIHNIHGYYVNYKMLFRYLRQRGVPIVWTLHDCWPFTGHCAHFEHLGCFRWKSGCYHCPGLDSYPRSLLLDRSRHNYYDKNKAFGSVLSSMTLVPVSFWLRAFIDDSFLRDAKKIVTIHNGIDVDVFTPHHDKSIREKYSIPESQRIVLGVASPWSERKGLDDFFHLRGVLDSNYAIVLVGLSKEQVKHLPPGLIGITRTDNQTELAQLYSCATVFVNPTYEDNYPTTNLEAMACGTPVLTYRTGGSPEAITEETGWVVEQGDINMIAEIVQSLSADNTVMREACRRRAELFFDKKKCFGNYIALYEDLLNK